MGLLYLCSATFTLYAHLSTQFLSGFIRLYILHFTWGLLWTRDKAVSIATGLRAGRIGARIPVLATDLSFSPKRPDPFWGALSLITGHEGGKVVRPMHRPLLEAEPNPGL